MLYHYFLINLFENNVVGVEVSNMYFNERHFFPRHHLEKIPQ